MQIEAGKYYMTRDGRKVGPAADTGVGKHRWNVRWDEGPFHYSNDGKSCLEYDDDDLIAECTDEPDQLTTQDMLVMLRDHIIAHFDICLENNDIEGAEEMIAHMRKLDGLND